jgi:hypothetical protein
LWSKSGIGTASVGPWTEMGLQGGLGAQADFQDIEAALYQRLGQGNGLAQLLDDDDRDDARRLEIFAKFHARSSFCDVLITAAPILGWSKKIQLKQLLKYRDAPSRPTLRPPRYGVYG